MRLLKALYSVGLLIVFAIGVAHATDVQNNDTTVDVEGAHHGIDIRDFAFYPASILIKPGDKITWINSDIAPHTATAVDGSWDTGSLKMNESYSLVVTEGMDLSYYCEFHPMMVATLQWDE